MSALQTFLDGLSPGMAIVAEAASVSEEDLVARGAPTTVAADLKALAHAYFGPTAYTRMQREAVAADGGHSITALLIIEKFAQRAGSLLNAMRLRLALCAVDPATPADRLRKLAAAKLRELKPPQPPATGVRLTRRRSGPWTLTLTGESATVADMHAAIRAAGDTVDAAARIFEGQSGARTTVTTNVIVKLEDLVKIAEGDGDDIVLRMTNGATLTGAQFVQRTLADVGLVTLIHPVEGPVNLYRAQRHASWKQRMMAQAESPECTWDGCHCPADECQVHHIVPWAAGGETNMANLANICRYHNGINDDSGADPPVRGRIARIGGRLAWIPPWDGPPRFVGD